MKKILITLILLSISIFPLGAEAQIITGNITWPQLVLGLTTAMWSVFVGVTIIAFLYAGILFLTASGDPQKIDKAKKAVIWGIAGVAVAFLAYTIINIVGYMLGA